MRQRFFEKWLKWWFDLAHRWRFGFLLAIILIGFQLAMAGMLVWLTPSGQYWLGPMVFNDADQAVYLNYLAQGKTGFFISNLYNNLTQVPRFDVLWLLGGLLVRAGLTPLVTHEILRWLCTIFLALAVYATAKTLIDSERRARLTSFLMLSGLSLGWLYAGWRDLGGPEFKTAAPTPPDLVTEFGTAPILLGGAHIILSLALQILIMRWLYELFCLGNKRRLIPTMLASLIFTWLHPYFIALVGCQIMICCLVALKKGGVKQIFGHALLTSLSLIPATAYYAWLAYGDVAFKTHYLEVNKLQLGSPWVWLITLLPLFWAAGRLLFKKIPREFYWPQVPRWVWFWIISALICLLLPFPWKRKYTQGLLMAGIILTLPYWLMVSESILTKWRTNLKRLFYFLFFIFYLSASYLYLFQTQLQVSNPRFVYRFYQTDELFEAWQSLASAPNNSLIITDNLWVNLWTPAYTGRRVWIGHAHETPDYQNRLNQYQAWRQTDDAAAFNRFLDENHITRLITTSQENRDKFDDFLDSKIWQKTFEKGLVTAWIRNLP